MAGWWDTMFGGGSEKEAAQKDVAAANQYSTQAFPVLKTGYDTGTAAINQAIGGYAPLTEMGKTYGAVAPTIAGALGVGSPDQVAAARSAYTASPEYQFSLDQAQQAAERAAAAGGMTRSGNLVDAEQKNAVGYASQDYGNWLKNLLANGTVGIQASQLGAAGAGAGYGDLAKLASDYAQNQANVYGNVEGATIGANNLQAAGEAAGAKNLLGAGLSLASLALGPAGGAMGGMGSSMLSGLFGGGQPSTGATFGGYSPGNTSGYGSVGGLSYRAFA